MIDFVKRDEGSLIYRANKVYNDKGQFETLPPLIVDDLNIYTKYTRELKKELDIYVNNSISEPIFFTCNSGTFNRFISSALHSSMHKKVLLGKDFKPKHEIYLGRVGRDRSSFLIEDSGTSWKNGPPVGYNLIQDGLLQDIIGEKGTSLMELPNYNRLISDCAKM